MLGGTVTGSPVKAKSDERRVINVVTTRRAGFHGKEWFIRFSLLDKA